MSLFSISHPYFSWKGKTFYEITTTLRKNTNSNTKNPLFFGPQPIKGYRREIASNTAGSCNQRVSRRIDELNAPGGSIVVANYTQAVANNGIIGLVDPLLPNNKTLVGNACLDCNNNPDNCKTTSTSSNNVCFRQDYNARRRCRSAGMIPRKFLNEKNNEPAYFTDYNQYLHSRNKQFAQNQYVYIRQGNPSITPGSAGSFNNVYSASGLSHCKKYPINATSGNNQLQYVWLNGITYTVTIPDGNYDIHDLNGALNRAMITNTHYYVNPLNFTMVTLLTLGYSTQYGVITVLTQSKQDYSTYTVAPFSSWGALTRNVPQLIVPSFLQSALKIPVGTYPAVANLSSTSTTIFGAVQSALAPAYVKMYYKPSNPTFAKQGGVSSSERLVRLKYNTIQTAAGRTTDFSKAMASSLAYGVPTPDYPTHIKSKFGYPEICTPVIKQYDNGLGLNQCKKFIYRSA